MSDADFYRVLGVGRSASAEEIRTAYRELVKKHHPDLFTSAKEKADATVKLRQVNEAYNALGNAERRRDYDEAFDRKQQAQRRASAKPTRRQSSPPPRRPAERRRKKITLPKVRLRISKTWAAYSVAAAAVVAMLIFAGRSEPRLTTAWMLVQKVENSPPLNTTPSTDPADGWTRVGMFASGPECAAAIKERVRKDEQEGSATVRDERSGMMAITVLVAKGVRKEQDAGPDSSVWSEPNHFAKRVRTLECRQTQRVEMEARWRQALRRLGGGF